jgi:uncharacterized short protein YbdD (DUF466 family)
MSGLWQHCARIARAMVGLPDYDTYRQHMAQHHPQAPVMDRVAFFRDRQQARYGAKGGGRCC